MVLPASSDRMLEKSLNLGAPPDVVIYDLEDSVTPTPHDKKAARQRLSQFLHRTPKENLPASERVAVRLNDISTSFFEDDMAEILRYPSVGTLVLPKIHSARDLHYVSRTIRNSNTSSTPLRIVASVESARSVVGLGDIASWRSEFGPEKGGELTALLVSSSSTHHSDPRNCADTSVVRTTSKRELLYVRSQIVIMAKAFELEAIDMVCVNYKDPEYLREECEDGRRLGFTGKQVIHPNQVATVNSSFVPTFHGAAHIHILSRNSEYSRWEIAEILRAAKILHQMDIAHSNQKGAFGLEMEGGSKEMIDAPMLKQAENVMRLARASGCDIPHVE
ncbi:citrate lyase beta subunit [Lanmaoa asiatica]|nr:citrate lyase beta subunit [Lanmaoa asiatica]